MVELFDHVGSVCTASHRILLHSRLISRKMPITERVETRLRVALGDPIELPQRPLKASSRSQRCIRCGWSTTSPSTCSGVSGRHHHVATGHNLLVHVDSGHIKTALSIESCGEFVDIKPLSDDWQQCWVTHELVHKVVVKRTTGEFICSREVFPSYVGPFLLTIDCRIKRDDSRSGLQARLDALPVSEKYEGNFCRSRTQLTGCPILDEGLLPGGTRHDVLDHLRRTAKHRALDRELPVLPRMFLILISIASCEN